MEKSNQNILPKLIVVLGPTAVGKSDVAVQIALALEKVKGGTKAKSTIGAEIISADSRQVYTGLDIGAGKITEKEMLGVPHFGLDIVSPKRRTQFSVAEFQTYTDTVISEIQSRGNIPILCGGTGFYIDAIVDGIVLPEVKTDPKLRKELESYDTEKLIKILSKLDKNRLGQIDTNNRVRLIRSIEIAKSLGKVPAIVKKVRFNTLLIGLDMDKEELMNKVHTRAIKRLKQGMINEAKKLHAEGVTWKRMKQFGLEYGLLAEFLQNKLTREQFIDRLLIETWKYAKRQRTWFQRRDDIQWFDPSKKGTLNKIIKTVKDFIKN